MNEDTTDNESIISNMGYIDSTNSNNSLSESSSNDSSSNDSQIIALTTLSDSDYVDDDDDDEPNDIPYMDLDYEDYDDIIQNRQVQAIYQDDKDHLDADKNDGCYYLGIYKHYSSSGKFLLINSISGSTFTKYSYDDIIEYLNCYSIALRWYSEIGIIQMHITNQVYYVVIKTYWLRLIQRVWKRNIKYIKRINKKSYCLKIHVTEKYMVNSIIN